MVRYLLCPRHVLIAAACGGVSNTDSCNIGVPMQGDQSRTAAPKGTYKKTSEAAGQANTCASSWLPCELPGIQGDTAATTKLTATARLKLELVC